LVKEEMMWDQEARDRLEGLSPEATDQEIIEIAADYLIKSGGPYRGKWTFKVLKELRERMIEVRPGHMKLVRPTKEERHTPPVEGCDWHYKNVWGITTDDPDRARDWVRQCMARGFTVFMGFGKHGPGGSPGSVSDIRERRIPEWQARRAREQMTDVGGGR
jgi:hypothetical protein